ncbi:hypothetical protein V6N13_142771 [Hibiscus sabdariffa]|uniref:AT-rich interactive domain-containing protein 2 n=1 Tax=Hibiscus sabdariffa TaxID=183260 RepID=A0ABR2FF81_9ROSI
MRFKRPFETEELHELPIKNPRQSDSSNKLTQFVGSVALGSTPQKPHISKVESGCCKYEQDEAFETDAALSDFTYSVDKNFETSESLSLVTSTSCEEDTGSGAAAVSPVSPEYPEFDFPQRMFARVEDAYTLLLDRSPRKQVLLGPNHQANVPLWGRPIKKDKFAQYSASDTNGSDYEEIMMGTCIIPMPNSDLAASDFDKVGAGKTGCCCMDSGSMRCVQQHVLEARKELQKSLGHEKFVKLGFYDMGEDVAYKWSEEDEEMFHEVVYSNPAALGKKFWRRLSLVFPSKSKRELVSYYFNVFILQRRAVQNRSSTLNIDSDDDEWHGSRQTHEVEVSEEEENSATESLADQEDLANNQGECLDEDDNDDDSGESDGNSGVGDYLCTAIRDDYGVNPSLRGNVAEPFDESRFDSVFELTENVLGVEDFNVQDDSCMSFEFQPDMVDSHGLIDTKASLNVGGLNIGLSKFVQSEVDGSGELVSHVYLLDTCITKIWDTRSPTASTKGIDLQPTCNIIEEIFGRHLGHQDEEK